MMNEKMNMQSLIDLLAEKRNMNKKDAELFVREFFLLIEQVLEDDKYVKIKGLGTFKLIDVESRESINVNSGERFEIQGHTKISFVPEASLRDAVNKPFAHFETVILNDDTVLEDTPINSLEEDVDDNSSAKLSDNSEQLPEVLINNVAEIETTTPEKIESVLEEVEEQVQVDEETDTEVCEKREDPELEEVEPVISSEKEHLSVEDIIALEIRKADAEDRQFEKHTSSNVYSSKNSIKKRSLVSYIVSTAIAIVLLCIGSVFYMYYPDLFNNLFSNNVQKISTEPALDAKIKTAAVPIDTFDASVSNKQKLNAHRDSIKETVALLPKKIPIETKKEPINKKMHNLAKQGEPFIPDSVNYVIVGTKATYTVQEGETLTKVSLRFYGTKSMWLYIVKHNRNTIKDPNKVPYGTILKIPELKKK